MRRAFGWLLPGQSSCSPLSGISAAAPAWLQHAVDAAANAASTSTPASNEPRRFATRSAPHGEGASQPPAQWPHDAGPGPGSALQNAQGCWHAPSAYPIDGNGAGWHEHGATGPPGPSVQAGPHSYPSTSTSGTAASELDGTVVVGNSLPCPGGPGADTAMGEAACSLSGPLSPLPLPFPPDCPALSTTAALGAAASTSLLPPLCEPAAVAAFATAEPSLFMSAVQQVAMSYEFVHTATGLPWAASIPLTSLALRLALLPLSMRQARILRTNFSIYKEAVTLTNQQEQETRGRLQAEQRFEEELRRRQEQEQKQQQGQEPGREPGQAGPTSGAAASQAGVSTPAESSSDSASALSAEALQARLLHSQAVLANFDMLRRKCDAPHPAWIVVNPMVQIPVFVMVSATLGMMCRAPWPGLSSEGALWFPDLTLPAVVMETGELPLGLAGLTMPLLVYGMTMTSLRLGFGAIAAQQQQLQQQPGAPGTTTWADTALGAFLVSLPPLLYAMTTLNLYFKVQMAHGVLVHWLGSASFTLALQMALRNPTLRTLLKMNRPAPAIAASADSTSSTSTSSTTSASSASTSSSSSTSSGAPASAASASAEVSSASRVSRWAEVPSELVARVEEETDPNILVIMGAQLSARHHYAGALHCLRKAVLLKPSHVRAHYSMGQVFSLTGSWPDAELSYRAAAEVAPPGSERGQALYCVATALHAQGKLLEAAEAYGEADANWAGQTVIAYGRANALAAAGRLQEAAEALVEAEARNAGMPGRPFQQALERLRQGLEKAGVTVSSDGSGDGGSGPAAAGDGRGQGEAAR